MITVIYIENQGHSMIKKLFVIHQFLRYVHKKHTTNCTIELEDRNCCPRKHPTHRDYSTNSKIYASRPAGKRGKYSSNHFAIYEIQQKVVSKSSANKRVHLTLTSLIGTHVSMHNPINASSPGLRL